MTLRTLPQMVAVVSSNLAKVGYDAEVETLYVEFKPKPGNEKGDLYCYKPVTAEEHAAMMAAKSIGGHLNTVIKPNRVCLMVSLTSNPDAE